MYSASDPVSPLSACFSLSSAPLGCTHPHSRHEAAATEATSRSLCTPVQYVHLAEYDSGRLRRLLGLLGAPCRAAVMDIQMSTIREGVGVCVCYDSALGGGGAQTNCVVRFDDSSRSSRRPAGCRTWQPVAGRRRRVRLLMYHCPPLQVRVAVNDLSLSLSARPSSDVPQNKLHFLLYVRLP